MQVHQECETNKSLVIEVPVAYSSLPSQVANTLVFFSVVLNSLVHARGWHDSEAMDLS